MKTENQVFDHTICRMQRRQTAGWADGESPLKERRIDLVKNPAAGKIQADSIGQIILENSVVENHCEIIANQTEAKV